MMKPLALGSLLLVTTALVAPASAFAQDNPPAQDAPPVAQDPAAEEPAVEEEQAAPEVSIPGGDGGEIVVRGRRGANIVRTTPQVVNVLSSEDIARTGEGNIAGSLGRVTGLSVVGNGYVYVRGLGDRYSLALLNGSPLPSPEPLKRVVPLDIFPTNVIASSLVQKSYSPNFPGEFGGGVINLTTKAVPTSDFLTIGGGIGGDTFTTGNLGYVYAGGGSDWTGFDDGTRNAPPALADFFASGERINDLSLAGRHLVAGQLINAKNALLQRNSAIPFNWSGNLTAGLTTDAGDGSVGMIFTAGYSNKWRTRDTLQQTINLGIAGGKQTEYERVITDNRTVINGLLSFGADLGDHKLRWTNLYIRDTIKQARLANGFDYEAGVKHNLIQDTAWYERQLIDTQVVGEFKFGGFSLDIRGSYANSQREAPQEVSIGYTERTTGPYAGNYLNRLGVTGEGFATVTYSDLNEDLYSGGIDFSQAFAPGLNVTGGMAYTDQTRDASRRQFQFIGGSTLPEGVSMLRPDLLFGQANIQAFNIELVETTETDPAFRAWLVTWAGYLQARWQLSSALSINAGARYEIGREGVQGLQVFKLSPNTATNEIKNEYWLPAATLTWELAPQMQLRVSGSKTLARPQFRELIFQQYYDPETNRQFRGNPGLTDSQLYNAEGRFEWYYARDQRVSLSGFYKKIERPIEAYLAQTPQGFLTSFANAPRATLYGAEFEAVKHIAIGGEGFFETRRLVLIGNYTFTKSKVSVKDGDTTSAVPFSSTRALDYFMDGRPLTGQSDHIGNLEIGLEDTDRLSQQTVLISYASRRLTSRGPDLTPDIYEYPGLRLDFVARQGITIAGVELEAKLEIRNITGRKYIEYQQVPNQRIYYNLYKTGTSANFGLSMTF